MQQDYSYRLIYFNARGSAELIRYIFAYAGKSYKDLRFNKEDWPKYKPYTPFRNVPVLEISDGLHSIPIKLAHPMTIARFLANQFGIAGSTIFEKARADMFVDQLVELIEHYVIVSSQNPIDPTKVDKLFNEIFPYYLNLFEQQLTAQDTIFFAANQLTWVDLAFSAFFDILNDRKDQILANFPKVKAIDTAVNYLPQIINWKSMRPITSL